MNKFSTILENTIGSMINVESFCRCPGKFYEFAWSKMDEPWCKSTKRKIDCLAKKAGLKTSLFSVYGTSASWSVMQELRIKIMDKMHLFVSPITWIPTEDFGNDFFIFAYFPLFVRQEFSMDDTVDVLPANEIFSLDNIYNLFRVESMRLNTMTVQRPFQAPYVTTADDKTPVICCKERPVRFKEFYHLADDSRFSNDLSSEEFADAVIKDLNMENEFIPELKLIVSHNPDKAATLYSMLSSRFNTSWIINVNMYNSKQCAVTFSFDDSRYDRTSKHHSLFYIPNNQIWKI